MQYPSSTLPSPPQSHCSTSSFDGVSDDNQAWIYSSRPASSYLNLRTRKRYRDDRPDQDIVHQTTLKKLFDAQRHSAPEDAHLEVDMEMDRSLVVEEVQPMESQADRKQRSIESFFGGKSRHARSNAVQLPSPVAVTLSCADCSAPLHTNDRQLDMTMMDVDCQMEADEVGDEWTCSSCRRRVCDTCAVRADRRTCLECVLPGGGMQQMWWATMNGCK